MSKLLIPYLFINVKYVLAFGTFLNGNLRKSHEKRIITHLTHFYPPFGNPDLKFFGKPSVDCANRVRVPRIQSAVRARPLRNVEFLCVSKVSRGSGTGSRAREPLADPNNCVRVYSGNLRFTMFYKGFEHFLGNRVQISETVCGRLRGDVDFPFCFINF